MVACSLTPLGAIQRRIHFGRHAIKMSMQNGAVSHDVKVRVSHGTVLYSFVKCIATRSIICDIFCTVHSTVVGTVPVKQYCLL